MQNHLTTHFSMSTEICW